MAGLQTEYAFILPKGYVDPQGGLHRDGRMRLATARDEIEPLRDSRAANADDPYLTILVLSRVIPQLGTLEAVTPEVVEGLFAADLAFLQDFYGIINFGDPSELESLQQSIGSASAAPVEDQAADGDETDDEEAAAAEPAPKKKAGGRRGQVEEVPSGADS